MSQPDSVQNSLLRLPLETVWLLPSLCVLVFLSYGIVPSVSDTGRHGVTPLIPQQCGTLRPVSDCSWQARELGVERRLEVVRRSPASQTA